MQREAMLDVRSRLALAAAVLLAPTTAALAQTKPAPKGPSAKELEQLAAEFLAVDVRTDAGHARCKELLARASAVPLDDKQRKAWQPRIEKAWSKGRTLETGGDNWFWESDKKKGLERRGRYVVGGQTKKPKGLLIAMHGGGAGSGDAGSAAGTYGAPASALDWVMIAPEVLEKTEHGWTDSGTEEFVLDLVDAALRTWKLDPDKVFFAGHSMGGYGSWTLGGHHADRIAAIAPCAGAPTAVQSAPGGPIVDISEGVIPSLRNVFVSVFQSLDDQQVPPAPNQFAAKLLGECKQKWGGFEHDYWEITGVGHGPPPGGHRAQLEKIGKRVRAAVPERLVWQPVLPWKRQFHWLWWETPSPKAIVVADLDRAKNAIAITCGSPTDGLYVLLDARVVDLAKEVTVTVGGAEVFRGKAAPELGTLLLTSLHPDQKLQFVARVPAFARKDG